MRVCLVVEDEPLARRHLCSLLRRSTWIGTIHEAGTLAAARAVIKAHDVQLAFLDIQLPDGRSLSLLDDLPSAVRIVFTTAFDEYAVTAFELQALDYLVKPFSEQRFEATLARVQAALTSTSVEQRSRALVAESLRTPPRIFARTGQDIVPIDVAAVDRIEGHDDHAAVWLEGRRYLVYRRLNDLEALLSPAGFVRVHRSVLVNIRHVVKLTSIDDGRVALTLSSGARVVASKARAPELRQRLRL